MSNNIRASLYMVLAMAGFTFNDALVKSLNGELPTIQIMAVRGLSLSVLIAVLIWQQGLLPRVKEAFIPLVGFRAAMELVAMFLFLSALTSLPFANISAILQALPLAVTVGAILVFAEPVGWRRWLAITVGFVGVLIIIRPGVEGFEFASILVVISVFFAAARDLATRALPAELPSLLVSAATAILVTLVGFAMLFIQGNWVALEFRHLKVLMPASVFLFFGYQFIVLAMRTGDVSYVVPYRYTSLLWSIFLGYLFFAEVPDSLTLIGSAVVVSMGLFTVYRELLSARRRRSQRSELSS
jgi:drug/metabolite transporter (DMT)-like permease